MVIKKKNNPQTQHVDAMSEGYLIRIGIEAYSHKQASLFTLLGSKNQVGLERELFAILADKL